MLIVPPSPLRKRPRRPRIPPAALTLIAADLSQEDPASLILTFDRAIDVAGYDGMAVIVNDGSYVGMVYRRAGP
jgi:hypothetical protein